MILNILEDTSHDSARQLMQAKGLRDLLIPGAAQASSGPVGKRHRPLHRDRHRICHVYVDELPTWKKL